MGSAAAMISASSTTCVLGAAVDAAGEQDHVGAEVADAVDLLVREAPVVGGDDVHDDGAGAEGGALGALSPVIDLTTPVTIICSPPPALEVET